VLLEEEGAKVLLPAVDKIVEYQEVITVNYPALGGALCVMDRTLAFVIIISNG
jgi:hypothetical protein